MKNRILKSLLIIVGLFYINNLFSQWSTNGSSIVYTTDNVGIGTSTPYDKLDIYGVLRFNGNTDQRIYGATRASRNTVVLDGNWDELEVKGRVIDWTGSNLHIGYDNNHSSDAIYIGNGKLGKVEIQGTTNFIVDGGNVGIRTTSPNKPLEIFGQTNLGSSATLRLTDYYASYSSYNVFDVVCDGSILKIKYGFDHNPNPALSNLVEIGANGLRANKFTDILNTAYYLDPANTGTSLKVAGNIDLNDGEIYLRNVAGNVYGIGYGAYAGSQMVLFSDDLITFSESDGSTKMVEWSMNNGTYKFNGKIFAEEVEIKTDAFSDFVFKDNYKLKSLEEVEDFISKNKHLPDVPSEAEVIENGINLGKMDAILLQKIEELTLYMIELKKENEEMRKNNDELKKMVENIKN